MSILNLTKDNFEAEVLRTEGTVLVDFWAAWCGPCRMLSPIVDAVAEEIHSIKVCKVNVDENQELALRYEVMSIPCLLVFRDGKLVNRGVGVMPKAKLMALLGM